FHRGQITSQPKEHRADLTLLQNFENAIRVTWMWTVVEGQDKSLCWKAGAISLQVIVLVTVLNGCLKVRQSRCVPFKKFVALFFRVKIGRVELPRLSLHRLSSCFKRAEFFSYSFSYSDWISLSAFRSSSTRPSSSRLPDVDCLLEERDSARS